MSKISLLYERCPVFLQNFACGVKGRQLLNTRYDAHFRRLRDELIESQWWDCQKHRQNQDELVRRLIQHAYETVPYYQEVMKSRGLTPRDFDSSKDLQQLPVLTKSIVQEQGDRMHSRSVDLRRDAVLAHTSGTTGAGMRFWCHKPAMRYQWAVWWRHRARFGLDLCQPHANFSGQMIVPYRQSSPPFWRENRPLKQTYLSLYHLKPENMQAYVDLLESRQFKYYAGYPSGVYLVADFLRSIGHTLGNPPEIIVTGAESLLPFQRKAFTEWIGAPSTDQYGQAEGVANLSRCEDDLYHEDMEFCVIEREKVTETPEGDVCRILGTALHNYAQPFIRYDTGDLASFNNRKCSCGRQTPVASCVDGRIESYVVTPDGRRVGRMDHCFKDLTSIREAQIVQHVPNELEVLLVPAPEFDGEVERELIDEIHSRVGGEMKVVVNITDAIPRTRTGKFRAVISKLDNELESHIQQ